MGCTTVTSRQAPPAKPAQKTAPQSQPAPDSRNTPANGYVKPSQPGQNYVEFGRCGFISDGFRGRPTANGEVYDPDEFTASHNALPFGTICLVTNLSNDRTVRVRINDRFQKKQDRIIYVSHSAAKQLGILLAGVVDVKLEVIDYPAGTVRQPNN